MKKYYLVLAALLAFGYVRYVRAAEVVDGPVGLPQAINADYGGVDLFISTFSAALSTVGLPVTSIQAPLGTYQNIASTTTSSTRHWRVYGAYFSSGSCGNNDFVEVFQSTGGWVNATGPTLRFYNTQGSTNTNNPASGVSSCSGLSVLRWPIRLYGSVFMRPSVATYNGAGLLYWIEP